MTKLSIFGSVDSMRTGVVDLLRKTWSWVAQETKWEKVLLVCLIVVAPFLTFYNLKYVPRSWEDEGAALTVSKTLAEEGVYASRNSDGYQTFGAIQSVGPTVLVPVALSFKLFGVGLVQGRLVVAVYALLTLVAFYLCALDLFGRRAALFAVIFLLSSSAVGFLQIGRQVLGEVPALGFFLWGWLACVRGVRGSKYWLYPVAGLLFGAAMVTKTQYTIIGLGALLLVILLDLFYYRQGIYKGLISSGLIAIGCVATWWGWQWVYFGSDVFLENVAKLRQLNELSTGVTLSSVLEALRFLLGSGSDHFYYFVGYLALLYVGWFSIWRNQNSGSVVFLVLFSGLWLGYYVLETIPVSHYVFAPAAIIALFVGKLYSDLTSGFMNLAHYIRNEIGIPRTITSSFTPVAMASLGTCVLLIMTGLLVIYDLQTIVRTDVMGKVQEVIPLRNLPQLTGPYEMAAWLNTNVDKDSVIETWERELAILSNHTYHFPDQLFLGRNNAAQYRNGPRDYTLGSAYLSSIRATYVIVGWFSRQSQIYDTNFLARNSDLVITIGTGDWRYDVYKLRLP